ncbi:MAG: flippase-like domain-containing protein [Fretibacterium sp.]|nr:flippase-like domain-containing protein [Fretibacterium sp.]
MKRFLGGLLRWGISLLCLVYAFHGVPLSDLWEAMSRFPVMPMIAAILVGFAAYAVLGVRLMFMNPEGYPHLTFRSTFCASLVGLALNNVLPAKAGEIAKAVWIGRDHGLSLNTSLGIVFMERFFDVNVLALLSLWFLWQQGQPRVMSLFLLCLAGGWAVLCLFRARPEWGHFWEHLPLPSKITDFLTRFTLSLVEQMSPRRLVWMTASSLFLWMFYAFQTAICLNGAAGLGFSWTETVAVFALSSLGMLLPSSPGAVGVYEAVMLTVLTAYNVPRDQALAVALFAHMAQFIPVTVTGGLVFLLSPRNKGSQPVPTPGGRF